MVFDSEFNLSLKAQGTRGALHRILLFVPCVTFWISLTAKAARSRGTRSPLHSPTFEPIVEDLEG